MQRIDGIPTSFCIPTSLPPISQRHSRRRESSLNTDRAMKISLPGIALLHPSCLPGSFPFFETVSPCMLPFQDSRLRGKDDVEALLQKRRCCKNGVPVGMAWLRVYYTLLELHAFSWPAALTTRLDKSHSESMNYCLIGCSASPAGEALWKRPRISIVMFEMVNYRETACVFETGALRRRLSFRDPRVIR